MQYKQKSLFVKSAFICVLIIIVGQFLYILKSTISPQQLIVNKQQLALIEKTEDIKKSFQLIDAALSFCKEAQDRCNQQQITIFTTDLDEEIVLLMELAAQEKKILSMSGLLDFDYIRLHIQKYNQTNDAIKLQEELSGSRVKFDEKSKNMLSIFTHQTAVTKQNRIYLLIGLNTLLLSLFIFGWIFIVKIQDEFESQKNKLAKTFTNILSDVKDLNHDSLTKRISNVETTPSEKKIYAMLLYSYEKLENEIAKTDLYQRLYNLLGNEIRGITNTIQGGIGLLIDNEDEQKKLQAKEIVTATRTLENLAENFNMLSTVDLFSDAKAIDFYQLASELIVLLATKAKQRNKTIESYVDNTIPASFYGHQTGLFWILLMQISDTIASASAKHILFTIGCTSAQRVDKLQLNIDLYLYEKPIASIATIESLPWGTAPKKIITNKALAQTLQGNLKNYQVIQKKTDEVSRVRISFDINPAAYQTESNKLQGRKFLICGDSYMQVDVIEKMLFDHGAEIIIARNPNEIFKSLNALNEHDGIFLTDTIHGVDLRVFCKIIKTRIAKKNIKIFLSFSTVKVDQNLYEHVDHIFYHPCPPLDFISSIVDNLDKDEEAKDSESTDKILIVEDDKLQQFILKKILNDFDFECDTADDGKEAIESVKENDYKIIFMDCIMPNIDGLEATEEIRRIEDKENLVATKIIGATALTSKDEHKKCIDAGMDFVIHKPYKKEEIFRVLKKYLAIKKVN